MSLSSEQLRVKGRASLGGEPERGGGKGGEGRPERQTVWRLEVTLTWIPPNVVPENNGSSFTAEGPHICLPQVLLEQFRPSVWVCLLPDSVTSKTDCPVESQR